MKTLTISLTIVMLVVSGIMQAGLLQTVAEIPGKAVEATATIVEDVVTAPGQVVQDVVTAPAKVVGATPEPVVTRQEAMAPEDMTQPQVHPTKAKPAVGQTEPSFLPEAPVLKEELKPAEPVISQTVVLEDEEIDDMTEPTKELAE